MNGAGAAAEPPGWQRDSGGLFLAEEPCGAAPVDFLQELPSCQAARRRRGGTRERGAAPHRLTATRTAEPLERDGGEQDARPARELPLSIAEKRRIRDFQQADVKYLSRWKKWKRASSKSLKKVLSEAKGLSSYLVLWRHDIHIIEGRFGIGVQSYFSFLRFLVLLNFIIFILMFSFVILPTIISNYRTFNSTIANISSNNIEYNCTIYEPSGNKGLVYFYTYLQDLLSGTGFLEVTSLFYGYYTINAVWISIMRYNLPLAYLLTTFAYLALSLIWIIKRCVGTLKQKLVDDADPFQSYSNKVFAGWDFCITDPSAAQLKHCSLQKELQMDLEEERLKKKKADRTIKEKLRIYSLRIFINIIVLAILLGCFYSIYRVTVFSQDKSSDISNMNFPANLLVQYLPSIVITSANFICSLTFSFLIQFEDYSPVFEVILTFMRCVFVYLANIGVLLLSLWSQISDCATDKCEPCGYNYKLYPCWESNVGQEMYKLMIFDFIVTLVVPLFVHYPRKLLITHCSCKAVQWLGLKEFSISDNVLEIIYGQTVCWIGTFFSPPLPAIATVKFFIVFYIKKISLKHIWKPADKPIRASSSNIFFLAVLLFGLILAFIPVGVSIAVIPSSKACGPFRNFYTSWEVVPATILAEFPGGLQQVLFVMASEAFAVPFFIVLCLIMFYCMAWARAQKRAVDQLKEQLGLEGRDKMFLIQKIAEAQRRP